LQQRVRDETIAKAKVAVKDVCAADGYSLVLESTVAPFGSNDVTDSCIKKMNASP
jgi:Skp family chaperone for outer membrane proteins